MKKEWVVLAFVILLSGCELVGALPGITAVAPITNIGDEADTITRTTNNHTDYVAWLVALVGWIAPSPSEIIKSCANFILKLFGRST